MTRTLLAAAGSLLLALVVFVAGPARALEAVGTFRSVDLPTRVLRVFAGGQLRMLRVAGDAKILDKDGKDLKDGLRAKELVDGAEVSLTVEFENNQPVLRRLQLGRAPGLAPGNPPSAPPKVDTSQFKPLTELGKGEYHGFTGGLYPDGANSRPAAHEKLGLALARQVQPLDAGGKPSAEGRIVLLTLGMSNTVQATTAFKQQADADPQKNPRVVIVNGASGGQTAARIQDAEGTGAQYWAEVDQKLQTAGVTRAQVQAVWIKEADAGPTQGFPTYARTLQAELARIAQLVNKRFPNARLAYLSSRTYGGYAKTALNPEPYAYESGFSVKWLIEQQLKGEAALNADAARGPVTAPWLSWGAYLWANGTTPRADGFVAQEADFAPDGTHESPAGQAKVGALLLKFFKTDSTTRGWFLR